MKQTTLPKMIKKKWYIGIDSGVNTGLAIWNSVEKEFVKIETTPIHRVMELITRWKELGTINSSLVRVEDARKRKWFGNAGREQLQGAGSIKRDAKIWEDFLTDLNIDFEMVAPANNKTKMDAAKFKQITGWTERTNEHSRDAAMLVFGF